jgi:hypothetical protein
MTASARMNGDHVPGPHEAQHLGQLRPVDVCAQQPFGARLIQHDAIELALRVLPKRTRTCRRATGTRPPRHRRPRCRDRGATAPRSSPSRGADRGAQRTWPLVDDSGPGPRRLGPERVLGDARLSSSPRTTLDRSRAAPGSAPRTSPGRPGHLSRRVGSTRVTTRTAPGPGPLRPARGPPPPPDASTSDAACTMADGDLLSLSYSSRRRLLGFVARRDDHGGCGSRWSCGSSSSSCGVGTLVLRPGRVTI